MGGVDEAPGEATPRDMGLVLADQGPYRGRVGLSEGSERGARLTGRSMTLAETLKGGLISRRSRACHRTSLRKDRSDKSTRRRRGHPGALASLWRSVSPKQRLPRPRVCLPGAYPLSREGGRPTRGLPWVRVMTWYVPAMTLPRVGPRLGRAFGGLHFSSARS
jgi:hypothetical protein